MTRDGVEVFYFCPPRQTIQIISNLLLFMKNLLRNILWSALLLAASSAFAQDFNLQLRSTLEFPGQTLANIYGYAQGGREYALIGASKGLVIVDITNPDVPAQITQLPGPNNLWKEIKTYSHYAYVTSEGGRGVQIVDLATLPSPNVAWHYFSGKGQFPVTTDSLTSIHALHIDTKKGFLYLYGGALYGGAARVFDLNADPYNPVYVGKFDQLGYIHDGYAENDTLYACHIYTGLLSITDMSDKANPKLLGTVQTPGKFTHNSWLLDDHKHILTTDETYPSFVTSYDISDPSDIKELDRFSTNDGTSSIGHNTEVLNDWAVTSWYNDGVVIIDAHRPDNLIEVARYDTWAPVSDKFDGCWGVYPYFPSGTIVASNIPTETGDAGKFFVLTPTYKRAAYLEGTITNGCTGLPMNGATITVNSNAPNVNTTTNSLGVFKTGQETPGTFTVTVSKPGFVTQSVNVLLASAQVYYLDLTLEPQALYSLNLVLINSATQAPLVNTPVVLSNANASYALQTNANGQVNISCEPGGDFSVGAWGYLPATLNVSANGTFSVSLTPGYYDDFQLDLGWTGSATATSGAWVREIPVPTELNNNLASPDSDSPNDANNLCYLTGNGGGDPGTDDVDNGEVTLTSPVMKLAAYQDAILNFDYWFVNGGGSGNANDRMEVRAISNGQTVTVFTENVSASQWQNSGDIHLKDFVAMSDNVQIQIFATDDAPGHVVESAIDVVKVTPITTTSTRPDLDNYASLSAVPNPSSTDFSLHYAWPAVPKLTLEVRNVLGQLVYRQALGSDSGTLQFGQSWPTGLYLATLRSENRQSAPLKMVKQ